MSVDDYVVYFLVSCAPSAKSSKSAEAFPMSSSAALDF